MKRVPYAILNVGIYFVVQMVPVVYMLATGSQKAGVNATLISFLVGALLMVFFSTHLKEPLAVEQKPRFPSVGAAIGVGAIGFLVLLFVQGIVSNIEIVFLHESVDSQNTDAILKIIQANWLFTLTTAICAPVMEEFVFRRSIIGVFGNRINFWLAATLSSILFAFIHMDGHLLLYFAMGMTLSILYRLTGRIWTSIIAHAGMNAFVVLVQLLLFVH